MCFEETVGVVQLECKGWEKPQRRACANTVSGGRYRMGGLSKAGAQECIRDETGNMAEATSRGVF